VKINLSLKIFGASSFVVQMVRGVLHDPRLFLACYPMVDTTFGVLLVVLFDDPHSDCEGVGPLSFIIMTLCILGGRVA
jgi:hypothetical protein